MSRIHQLTVAIIVGATASFAAPGQAQQTQVTTPLVNTNQSFYEQIGVSWGYQSNRPGGFSFNFGNPGATAPAFGGFNPNSQANFGFGARGKGGTGFFNLTAGQGSNRSIVSSASTLMLQNGIPGSVQDVSRRPFVTSFTPVVGDRSGGPASAGSVVGPFITGFTPMPSGQSTPLTFTSPLQEKLGRLRQQAAAENPRTAATDGELLLSAAKRNANVDQSRSTQVTRSAQQSSATRGDISVAEIRGQRKTDPQVDASAEIRDLVENARLAEARGLPGAARMRYRKAAALATGQLKEELLTKVDSLK